jgi:hypothetical protein
MLTDESRKPATILAEWRSAERLLPDAAEGSPEYDALPACLSSPGRTTIRPAN